MYVCMYARSHFGSSLQPLWLNFSRFGFPFFGGGLLSGAMGERSRSPPPTRVSEEPTLAIFQDNVMKQC